MFFETLIRITFLKSINLYAYLNKICVAFRNFGIYYQHILVKFEVSPELKTLESR